MRSHKELKVFQLSFDSAMEIYRLTEKFPKKETYSLNDQILRSSRSVCGNIAEAFRKRNYAKSFILSLHIGQGEAAETQVWLDFALQCNYISTAAHEKLYDQYDHIIAMLVNMCKQASSWSE